MIGVFSVQAPYWINCKHISWIHSTKPTRGHGNEGYSGKWICCLFISCKIMIELIVVESCGLRF